MNAPENTLELNLQVEIRQPYMSGSGLRITEQFSLQPRDFLELCEILTQFHRLAEMVAAKRAK